MLNSIISRSLQHRWLVIAVAVLLVIVGAITVPKMAVDVLPDLNRPVVTIMTEAHGLGPEETETLVSIPIETTVNGATGVQRVRSASSAGFSIVFVEFDWGTDVYRARQVVNEKLQTIQSRLPAGSVATLAPISSIMGEIMIVSLQSDSSKISPLDVRSYADFVLRPRLLAVPGVSQVIPIGGGTKQFQIITNPVRLKQYGVTLEDVLRAGRESTAAAGGGFFQEPSREAVIRIQSRAQTIEDIKNTPIRAVSGLPVTIGQVADVMFAKALPRGDGSVDASPAVLLSIQKQPDANTLQLTKRVDTVLNEIENSLPNGVTLNRELFRQSHFIERSIKNVERALLEATAIVFVVILAFLLNIRATLISLVSIPVSFIVSLLVLDKMGININTMTLGGLAIAIGLVVDDSIVDVENVYRRLRENRLSANPKPFMKVIYGASAEVRNSIFYATLIIVLVFVPLLSLEGMEGRVFLPLGIAFIASMLASLFVSLTLTPALCGTLLGASRAIGNDHEPALIRSLKRANKPLVMFSMQNPVPVVGVTLLLAVIAGALTTKLGREFLPKFNEGSLSLSVILPPGSTLAESNRIGTAIEKAALSVPQVTHVGRRTGRAELDEHAEGVNHSEMDIGLKTDGKGIDGPTNELRKKLGKIPGVFVAFGQPISHRLDHLSSGVRAAIAVKIFGPDLNELRRLAQEVETVMKSVPGMVDLQIEPQVEVPLVNISIDRTAAARYGVTPFALADYVEVGLGGHTVAQVLQGQRRSDVVVWFDEEYRTNLDAIRGMLVDTPTGQRIPLAQLATVRSETGPNTINRENVSRRIAIQANVAGRDLNSVITDLQTRMQGVQSKWKEGYYVAYGGQFQSQQSAMNRILLIGCVTVVGIFMVLNLALRSWRLALQVMVNLPLALVGGVLAVSLTGGVLSVASLVGFITLFGIATRNGIMMLSHYMHLIHEEGLPFSQETILRGTQERLSPVLMTALAAALGLLPLAVSVGQPGKELLQPIAVVILGGLFTSTFLDQMVTPALFWRFGAKDAEPVREIDV